jgi:hypothetical protein
VPKYWRGVLDAEKSCQEVERGVFGVSSRF